MEIRGEKRKEEGKGKDMMRQRTGVREGNTKWRPLGIKGKRGEEKRRRTKRCEREGNRKRKRGEMKRGNGRKCVKKRQSI